MYFQHVGDLLQVILLYVDDILIKGSLNKEIGPIKSSLHSEFSMIDLGLLKEFLGLEIEKYKVGIKVRQKKVCCRLVIQV